MQMIRFDLLDTANILNFLKLSKDRHVGQSQ
jgi:hypothetical protein